MNSPSTSFTVPTTATTATDSRVQATDSEGNHNLTVTQTSYYDIQFDDNNNYYDTSGTVLYTDRSYWVASRCTDCNSERTNFGLHFASSCMYRNYLFLSDNIEYIGYVCIRPLVSLKANDIDTSLGKDSDGAWQIRTK